MLFEDRTANSFAVSDFIPDLKMRGFHPPACPSRDYKVNGSGMLKLNHSGRVMGKVKRNLSGMCSLNI